MERLAIFHHAGGSSYSFLKLARALAGHYEVLLAEIPGRATRQQEPAPDSLLDFARTAAAELKTDLPLTLYGHSMGAGLAYECAAAMEEKGAVIKRVVVSCCRAPGAQHMPSTLRERAPETWTDADLLRAMAAFGRIPKALESAEAQAYFLPLFRLDLTLIRKYRSEARLLAAPILGIAGREDGEVRPTAMGEWAQYTRGQFQLRTEAGGHFCVLEDPALLVGLFERLAVSSPC